MLYVYSLKINLMIYTYNLLLWNIDKQEVFFGSIFNNIENYLYLYKNIF